MTTLDAPLTISTRRSYLPLGGVFLGLILLLVAIGSPPVSRTQEARVLETSRQMLGTGWQGWMLPILNGEPRLKKPPLAYWMTGASYLVFGASEQAGRIPTAIIGWLTLIATYIIARWAFDHRVALASSVVLLGSFQFFRFTRLAETDAPAMLFLTIAIGAIWRSASDRRARWMHLAAAATAVVILSKGAPAAFVLVFLIAFCAIERRWDVAIRFILSGAPITLLAIAAPWFIYVRAWDVFGAELANTTTGGDHFHGPHEYIPALLIGIAPWTGFLPLALFDAIRRWRIDPATRVTLLWLASILIPLCINGNKQNHYLLMLMPPTMILIGRLLITATDDLDRWIKWIFVGTIIIAFLATVAPPIGGSMAREKLLPVDWIAAGALLLGVLVVVWLYSHRGMQHALAAFMVAACLLMPLLQGIWVPTLEPHSSRSVAARIKELFGDGPYVFYGPAADLPLAFALRTTIRPAHDEKELLEMSVPGTLAISMTKATRKPLLLPDGFNHMRGLEYEDAILNVHRFQP